MFIHHTAVRLSDTDATGVLFFPQQLRMAIETFEEFLRSKGLPLRQVIAKSHYLIPVVHAESDYLAPLFVGDTLEITMQVASIGTKSFTTQYHVVNAHTKQEVGKVSLVHVLVNKETRASFPIPSEIRELLQKTAG